MKVVFRVDASLAIGTGHVIRCLTLAQALTAEGAECHFLCREHPGHLIEVTRTQGFATHVLPVPSLTSTTPESTAEPAHAHWLGATWQDDAQQSHEAIERLSPDWLVVDHYALDKRWERRVLPQGCRLLVIDDLADREHCADLLLDQNLGRRSKDYSGLVPASCRCLIGPQYALLRPEFARLRADSIARRRSRLALRHLLISLGGVDKDNATGKVLDALKTCELPEDCRISVIMGTTAPWLASVQAQAACMPWPTEVAVNVADMARRMASADLAIGAAGSTSWERCCIGLPTLMIVLAANQLEVAKQLVGADAALLVGVQCDIETNLPRLINRTLSQVGLYEICSGAADISDGCGLIRVLEVLETVSRGQLPAKTESYCYD